MMKKNQVALRSNEAGNRVSVLGPTLTFRGGELSSDEDLIIEGTIEGSIAHHSHKLTISRSGKVKADVHARVVLVEGFIEGDMTGDEAVHVASTARVIGNISAPLVRVDEGASLDGHIKTAAAPTRSAMQEAGGVAKPFDANAQTEEMAARTSAQA